LPAPRRETYAEQHVLGLLAFAGLHHFRLAYAMKLLLGNMLDVSHACFGRISHAFFGRGF
jgi:hypothetical protein